LCIQSPGVEAIETVSVVTSSFDADQGSAGGAAINVQKTGTNQFRGSAFEYAVDAGMRACNYFLPAGQSKDCASGDPSPRADSPATNKRWLRAVSG
jgi:hypothetical protein